MVIQIVSAVQIVMNEILQFRSQGLQLKLGIPQGDELRQDLFNI